MKPLKLTLMLLAKSILFLSSTLNAADVRPMPTRSFTWHVEVTHGHQHFRSSDLLIIRRTVLGDVVSVTIKDPKPKTYFVQTFGREYIQQKVDKFIMEYELDPSEKVCLFIGPNYLQYHKTDCFTNLSNNYAVPGDTDNWASRLNLNK